MRSRGCGGEVEGLLKRYASFAPALFFRPVGVVLFWAGSVAGSDTVRC